MLKPDPTSMTFARNQYLRDNKLFFEALADARSWVSGVVSPADALCQPVCAIQSGNLPLYFDDAHPTKSSAQVWAGILKHDIITE